MPTQTAIKSILLSASEAAALLGIGRSLFYSLHSEGKIPAPRRLGGRVLWSKQELEQWINNNCPNRQKWESIKDVI